MFLAVALPLFRIATVIRTSSPTSGSSFKDDWLIESSGCSVGAEVGVGEIVGVEVTVGVGVGVGVTVGVGVGVGVAWMVTVGSVEAYLRAISKSTQVSPEIMGISQLALFIPIFLEFVGILVVSV